MSEPHKVFNRRISDETQLVQHLVRFLKRQHYRVRLEVSTMGQSADVVAVRGRWVTMIEAKIKDWARAVRQCQTHEQIADYICIAVALTSIPAALEQRAHELGYGLIHFSAKSRTFKWVLRPRLNKKVWTPQRRCWSRSLRGVPYEN